MTDRPLDPPWGPDPEQLLAAVSEAAGQIGREEELNGTLEAVVRGVRRCLQLERASVFLYDPASSQLTRRIAVDRDGNLLREPGPPIGIGESPVETGGWPWSVSRVVLGRVPFVHVGAHVVAPLIASGEICGALVVDNHFSGASIPDILIPPLCLYAQFAAVALRAALAREEDRRLRETVELLSEELRHDHRVLLVAFEAAGEIARERNPGRMLASVIHKVRGYLEVDNVGVYGYSAEPPSLRRLAFVDHSEAGLAAWEFGADRDEAGNIPLDGVDAALREVVTGNQPFAHLGGEEASGDSEVDGDAISCRRGVAAGRAVVPLIFHGAIVGAMVADNHATGREIPEQLVTAFRFFAHFGAVAVTSALKREEQLQSDQQKKRFYRDVVYAVTGGKLILCPAEEIQGRWRRTLAEQPVTQDGDIKLVRDAAHEVGRQAGMSEERLGDLGLCVSEAATNALRHAGGGVVSLDVEEGSVRIRVADQGGGIDPLQLPCATLMKGYSTADTLGLGFTLMHELSDRLYLNTGSTGTTVLIEMAVSPLSDADKLLALLNMPSEMEAKAAT